MLSPFFPVLGAAIVAAHPGEAWQEVILKK